VRTLPQPCIEFWQFADGRVSFLFRFLFFTGLYTERLAISTSTSVNSGNAINHHRAQQQQSQTSIQRLPYDESIFTSPLASPPAGLDIIDRILKQQDEKLNLRSSRKESHRLPENILAQSAEYTSETSAKAEPSRSPFKVIDDLFASSEQNKGALNTLGEAGKQAYSSLLDSMPSRKRGTTPALVSAEAPRTPLR
jgi:hypothetical protein